MKSQQSLGHLEILIVEDSLRGATFYFTLPN